MKRLTLLFILIASPALAAGDGFFSLFNTDFVVVLAFLVFIGVVLYYKVPGLLMGLLDQRAEGIRNDLDEARALREEAQTILASYERKQREVAEQSERIIAQAREEAQLAAAQARADLEASIVRRVATATDQIASAEAGAVREVRDRAVSIAVEVAAQVIASKTSATEANKLIDAAISDVETRLH
jgi:F-type H+-transporting ATPase subunit b